MTEVRALMTSSHHKLGEWYRKHRTIDQFAFVKYYHDSAFKETDERITALELSQFESVSDQIEAAADAIALFSMAWRCWTMIIKTLIASP